MPARGGRVKPRGWRSPGSLEMGRVERRKRPPDRRRSFGRRKGDLWKEIGKLLGLTASVTGALIGQAELVGEPYRHYLTVLCIGSTGGFGYLLGPDSVRILLEQWRSRK
jgi:hypothetical protein